MKTVHTALRRLAAAAMVLAGTALLAGCNELHPRNTLEPIADSGTVSAWFYNMLYALDVVVLVIVVAFWGIALVKFRKKPGDDTLPEQSFGNMKLEVAWTILPTIIVVGITIPTLGGVFELAKRPDANQPIVEVEVTGKQWWWEFDYKKSGVPGDLGGIINTANELHVQVGTQVVLHMTSADVIHSWWVPRIGGKRDATPGRSQPFYFKARETGTYDGQCAELCGASHALMGTRIIVHPKAGPDSYADWVQHEREDARKPTSLQEEAGLKVFSAKGCVACHTIQGVSSIAPGARQANSGPNLTHVGSRTGIGANTLKNTPENIAKWVLDPGSIKPGSLMPNLGLNATEAADLAAYLTSLK